MNLRDKVRVLVANMQTAITSFENIKKALMKKGVDIPEGTPQSEYASKIAEIQDGSAAYENGYNAGYESGHTEGRAEGYNEGETAGYTNGYAEGQNSVPNPLEYANSVYNSFKGVSFPTGYEIALNLPRVTSLFGAFQDTSGIKKATVKGNENENTVDFGSMCRACRSIETIDLTEFNVKPSTVNLAFYYCEALKYIYGELDFGECTNTTNWLQTCKALKEIRFKANTIKISISFSGSSLLSANSIQSIVDGLATVETTQTLSLHSTTAATLTDEQYNTIFSKNWQIQ